MCLKLTVKELSNVGSRCSPVFILDLELLNRSFALCFIFLIESVRQLAIIVFLLIEETVSESIVVFMDFHESVWMILLVEPLIHILLSHTFLHALPMNAVDECKILDQKLSL